MRVIIYEYTGYVTRSILRASEVASFAIDDQDDADRLAHEYGGDFIEIDNSEDED
jgi:hypothetical protein